MPESNDAAPLLEMQGITKRFGSLEANSGIDLSVSTGEIHGLLGENGAGKTTLMRILSGFTEPDAGEIRMEGRAVHIRGPQQAMALGIGMVHQQWRLVERFTVYENLLLGQKDRRDTRELRREIDELGERFRLSVRLNAYVWQLSLGERQRVEILRVLQRGARLLILDEPTAVLSPQETEQLFGILRDMVSEGRSVVFISHKLREVLEHCHRITVLRHGKVVAVRDGRSVGGDELARLMVGRTLPSERVEKPPVRETTVLELDGVDAVGGDFRSALRGVSFRIRSGEILGVAGVSGNGQKELADLCSGLARPVAGSIRLAGNELSQMSAAEVNAVGVGFVPEDRLGTGVCPNLPVAENLILRRPGESPFARLGIINRAAVTRWAGERVREFDIRLQDVWAPIGRLSGGNMQKAVVARELSARPAMLVAAQPTRGLDVAAMDAVHRILLEMRNEGGAILLISEDLDEILKLSDRLIVLHDGRIAGEFTPDAGREEIGLAMTGGWTPAAETGPRVGTDAGREGGPG